ncbi:hypothetical protein [Halobellus sp. GM3]|uniref:hypothetical protein n=1 Tax=Halobellus sp. GM3 TaxID=3458410 RepID=UPI00403DDC0A
MGTYTKRDDLKATMQEIFELFQILVECTDQLESMGGCQQEMRAIGKGLMARLRILALDEPFEGLAP